MEEARIRGRRGDVRRRLVLQEARRAKTDVKTRRRPSEGPEKRIRTVVISAQGVVLLLSVPPDIEILARRKLKSSLRTSVNRL